MPVNEHDTDREQKEENKTTTAIPPLTYKASVWAYPTIPCWQRQGCSGSEPDAQPSD